MPMPLMAIFMALLLRQGRNHRRDHTVPPSSTIDGTMAKQNSSIVGCLNANLPNLHPREDVPLTRFLAEVLAAAHFLDDELLALFGANHFGGDGRTLHERRAKLRIAGTTDGQDGFEI